MAVTRGTGGKPDALEFGIRAAGLERRNWGLRPRWLFLTFDLSVSLRVRAVLCQHQTVECRACERAKPAAAPPR